MYRGSLSDPFHEWGPAADPGGTRALPAASPHPVLRRGTLRYLLWQGTVLPLQCQRQTAEAHGSGRWRQGEDTITHVRLHVCVCTASAYKVLSLIKSSVLVLDASEVKVAVPRDKLTASHLFFPFHPHYTRGKASFDPELCCQVKLRWRRWRKTFQRSGQLWTPTPLTTLQRGTTHSPFPTFPPSWLGWHKIATTAFSFPTRCVRFGLGNVS